jgi:hypothetical protein
MFFMADLGDFLGCFLSAQQAVLPKTASLDFSEISAAPSKLDCVRKERSAATCCRVVSADKKKKIQVQGRSVLIENNILIALFISL